MLTRSASAIATATLLGALASSAGCAPADDDPSDPAVASTASAVTPVTKKVMLVVYDPVMSSGQKLHQYMGWFDPAALMPQIYGDISTASSGYLNYQTVLSYDLNEWPAMQDGFRFNETSYLNCLGSTNKDVDCHTLSEFDYLKLFNDFSICSKLQSGEIDEVVLYGAPWFDWDEFAWKLPGDVMPYYTPTNPWLYANRKKNLPDCGKSVFIMGYNYERGVPEALESYGHRIESALSITVGRGFWDGCPGNATYGPSDWDHFTCLDKDKTAAGVTVAGCGNSHFPPNGRWDYDDNNTDFVDHACSSWNNYPFATKTIVTENSVAWGGSRLSFLRWWMAGLPVLDGANTNGNLNNWWRYIADYDSAIGGGGGGGTGSPNLQPTAITMSPLSPTTGVLVSFDSGVSNTGSVGSGTFNVKWFVDGVDVGAYGAHVGVPQSSTVMDGNSQFSYTFTTGGTHTVSFRVDVDGFVAESNEGDNQTSITFYVTPAGCIASVPSGSWTGRYWNNLTLSGSPMMTRDDGAGFLNFNWGTGSPSAGCGVPVDNFSARWTRSVYFAAGKQRFSVTADDGFRLYVDNVLRIDKWFDQAPTTYTVDLTLTAGNHALQLDYYDRGAGAVAKLSWGSTAMNGNTPTGQNLVLNAATSCTSDSVYGTGWDCSRARDGVTDPNSKWTSTGASATHWLTYDLGWYRTVNGYIVRHAGAAGEWQSLNTQQFRIETANSLSGPWTIETTVDNSAQAHVTYRTYSVSKVVRFIRLYITDPGSDNYARIPEFEVRGP